MIDPRFYKCRSALPLNELLTYLDMGQLDGAMGETMIESPAALNGSKPSTLSYLADKRRANDLDAAQASACFVTEKLAEMVSEKRIIPLLSSSPRASFARAAMYLAAPHADDDADDNMGLIHPSAKIDASAKVHMSAVIGADVTIAKNVKIGPYVVIDRGVEIGAGTIIDAHSQISFSRIGPDCRIKSGAIIGGSGFGVAGDEKGLVNIPHLGRVLIGERVYIGSQTCIDRGQLGDTVLGDDVKIDNLVQIAHNVTVGKGTMMAGHVGISGSCVIGEHCQLGGRVGLADHITVGDGAILTASSGVAQNIPAGEMWGGTPALPFREHMRIFAATRKLARRAPKNNTPKINTHKINTPKLEGSKENAPTPDETGDTQRSS